MPPKVLTEAQLEAVLALVQEKLPADWTALDQLYIHLCLAIEDATRIGDDYTGLLPRYGRAQPQIATMCAQLIASRDRVAWVLLQEAAAREEGV